MSKTQDEFQADRPAGYMKFIPKNIKPRKQNHLFYCVLSSATAIEAIRSDSLDLAIPFLATLATIPFWGFFVQVSIEGKQDGGFYYIIFAGWNIWEAHVVAKPP